MGMIGAKRLLAGCPSCRQTPFKIDPLIARVWAMGWMRKYR